LATIDDDIGSYERWLRQQCDVVDVDLLTKYQRMLESPFAFLRATYFRWASTIESVCPALADAPRTLCVGDTHVENFGTWRDAQARLVWGVNDFDEAAVMPYPYDLVRLATSARLAPALRIDGNVAASAILLGYLKGLLQPRPFLLDERAHWMKPLVAGKANASAAFWREVERYPCAAPPAKIRRQLRRGLPAGSQVIRFASRSKGLGGLERPRYLVIAEWDGGQLVREAKAWVPSAWYWAHSKTPRGPVVERLARGPFRAPEQDLQVLGHFIYRSVAPDSHKVELSDIGADGLGERVLAAMGADLGAIHAGRRRKQILRDLRGRPSDWLRQAAAAAERATKQDLEAARRK